MKRITRDSRTRCRSWSSTPWRRVDCNSMASFASWLYEDFGWVIFIVSNLGKTIEVG